MVAESVDSGIYRSLTLACCHGPSRLTNMNDVPLLTFQMLMESLMRAVKIRASEFDFNLSCFKYIN